MEMLGGSLERLTNLGNGQGIAERADGLMQLHADVADRDAGDIGDFSVRQTGVQTQPQDFLLPRRQAADLSGQPLLLVGPFRRFRGTAVGRRGLRNLVGRNEVRLMDAVHVNHSGSTNGKQPSRDPAIDIRQIFTAQTQEGFLHRVLSSLEVASAQPLGIRQQQRLVLVDQSLKALPAVVEGFFLQCVFP